MNNNAHYWVNREVLSEKAKEHTKEMTGNYAKDIAYCIEKSKIYSDNFFPMRRADANRVSDIELLQKDTVSAAFSTDGKVTILNFASYKNPGGGFLSGSSAQEESLCHASFLFNVLVGLPEYYEWNNKNLNRGMYKNRAVYTPDVLFFHGKEEKKCDVITCGAPNRSVLEMYGKFSEEENLSVLIDRIRFIRDIALDNNVKTMILGAWGCGVFRQNPKDVARLFINEFEDTGIRCIYGVPDEKTYNVFNKVIDMSKNVER